MEHGRSCTALIFLSPVIRCLLPVSCAFTTLILPSLVARVPCPVCAVDHSKVQYAAFRKNLYIVPRALARLTDEEVADRREDLQIKVV